MLGRRQGLGTEGSWVAHGVDRWGAQGHLPQRGGWWACRGPSGGSADPRPQGRPWQRQFPPKAHSVPFSFELKCKQASVPAAVPPPHAKSNSVL